MSKRILIVENASTDRSTLRGLLSMKNYDVVGEASTGREALEMFQELKPDLVTVDMEMPIRDGIETLCRILRLNPNAKIVMSSEVMELGRVKEAVMLGAQDFIPKPYDLDGTFETLERVLAS